MTLAELCAREEAILREWRVLMHGGVALSAATNEIFACRLVLVARYIRRARRGYA